MAFSPRNIVGCLLKKRLTKGGGGHGHPRTPLATPFLGLRYILLFLLYGPEIHGFGSMSRPARPGFDPCRGKTLYHFLFTSLQLRKIKFKVKTKISVSLGKSRERKKGLRAL